MGNKTAGRAMVRLPFEVYSRLMGAQINSIRNTGISPTNAEVYKYFKELRGYYLNRIRWYSDQISERELRLIEWNIFHNGRCALLRPKIIRENVKFTSPLLKVYQCNFTDTNARNGWPHKISIINSNSKLLVIDVNYDEDEFVIFTDEFLFPGDVTPFQHLAWEFACKLHELDLAFNANSHRLRMPFVFGNAAVTKSQADKDGVPMIPGVGVAETMRSAMGRNEQYVEIPDEIVGEHFLHEPQHVENHMLEHLEAQKKLYDAYFERIGLRTNKEKAGSYTVKELQEQGDESPNFITECTLSTRRICAERASDLFGIKLAMEVIG